MSAAGSVSHWLARLKTGDPASAQPLWENNFRLLVQRPRQRLAGTPRHRRGGPGRQCLRQLLPRGGAGALPPRLHDRDGLWQVLVVLADRKAINLIHRERRARRGGGQVVDERALAGSASSAEGSPLEQLEDPEPTPEFGAQLAAACQRLFACLPDDELRWVALGKLEGYTVEEIAAKLGCVPRTADRRLRLIRSTWEKGAAP
jgi:ECF sigma factor